MVQITVSRGIFENLKMNWYIKILQFMVNPYQVFIFDQVFLKNSEFRLSENPRIFQTFSSTFLNILLLPKFQVS